MRHYAATAAKRFPEGERSAVNFDGPHFIMGFPQADPLAATAVPPSTGPISV
jgi:hypothetical protein